MTILRGKVIVEDGRIVGGPGDGVFLERDVSPFAAPA
jgi:dihydropyrimidinase